MRLTNTLLIVLFISISACAREVNRQNVITGASQIDSYLGYLEGKRVGIVANHTSLVGNSHLVDTLLSRGVGIERIFSPEHGFRGNADAGALIEDGTDSSTGLKVVSLYGANRKPAQSQLEGLDIIVFDIQDVGARFYTYISTLQYVMEVSAEIGIEVLILDRPNPNGHYVDGPVLDTAFRSFVGMQPVPVVHGMTVAEYALMLNGERWLADGVICRLKVIPCLHYNHNTSYTLPVPPSPNLPNQNSVYLYPSICFFEGTLFSCGRGTSTPFQLFGHPDYPERDFSFTPVPAKGAANPKLNGQICYGVDLSEALERSVVPQGFINLEWLIEAYTKFPDKDRFFNSYFNTLAGNRILKQQIIDGFSVDEIRMSWQDDLKRFNMIRDKYLLY